MTRVGIIGAGVSGLATARVLLAEGFECTVFDRANRIGGVWAANYSGFGVQVQKELYEFPDWPLPDDAPDFTPGPVFQQYLENYVDHFDIRRHLRLSTTILEVIPHAGGADGWTVRFERDGQTKQQSFDLVVVASGLFSEQPVIPDIEGRELFRGEILHTGEVATRAPLEGKRVAVIGYGKSAADVAMEASEVADEVHLIFRDVHWPVPQKLAGVVPFKYGLLSRMAAALVPPYRRATPLVRALHTIGKPLVWLFWRLVEVLLTVQWGLRTKIANGKNLVPSEPVEVDCFSEAVMLPRPNLYRAIREGRIVAHRTEVAAFSDDGIVLEDGDRLDIDCVVFGTGWKAGYGFLDETARERLGGGEDGFYLYRHVLHPDVPNMYFIGRTSSIQSILTYCLQARWLAELLRGRFELPSRDDMLADIDDVRSWKQSWMPYSAARSARLLLHALHYHDDLLCDIGADPLRKSGVLAPLKELVAPYQASDYGAVVAGE